MTLDDLGDLRWKCGSCAEWHTGACLDFSYAAPYYWSQEYEKVNPRDPEFGTENQRHFSTKTAVQLRINISLSVELFICRSSAVRKHFVGVCGAHSAARISNGCCSCLTTLSASTCQELSSWLSNQIDGYPDTLNLKMYARIQPPGSRPIFELEPTDHPVAQEYHHGIAAERVKEIMMGRLPVDD